MLVFGIKLNRELEFIFVPESRIPEYFVLTENDSLEVILGLDSI